MIKRISIWSEKGLTDVYARNGNSLGNIEINLNGILINDLQIVTPKVTYYQIESY